MTTRIGIDLLRVDDLVALSTRPWFLATTFTPAELSYGETLTGSRRDEFLAGRFAAKEAVAKLLGSGFGGGVRAAQIEIGRTDAGAPQVTLHGAAAEVARRLDVGAVAVSIAHKHATVAAVAIACGSGAGSGDADHQSAAEQIAGAMAAGLDLEGVGR